MTVPSRPLRRFLVALDASGHGVASLHVVVELAALLRGEVSGLFVEDTTLLRIAAMPMVRRVSISTGSTDRFDVPTVERALRRRAAEFERCLADAATRRNVKWSFRVVRGECVTEVASAAGDADVLVVDASDASVPTRHAWAPMGQVVESVSTSVLLVPAGGTRAGSVIAACTEAGQIEPVLGVAEQLAGAMQVPLEVWLVAASSDVAEELAAAARGRGPGVEKVTRVATESKLRDHLGRTRGGLLVTGAHSALRRLAEDRGLALLMVP